MSSIALCGAIVELVTEDFFRAYAEKIPKGQLPKKREVTKNLSKLRRFGILTNVDYRRVSQVRKIRDDHVHLKMLGRGVELLRSDNAKALRNLCEFFDESNMKENYEEYFFYAGQLMRKLFQAKWSVSILTNLRWLKWAISRDFRQKGLKVRIDSIKLGRVKMI